ncbi:MULTISPECIES: hypothetical protein [unclassified Roseateles]|uniref:hypothetical protein n=1 Tax=unclassified Roseateles TaxID=2626991 RepID=UPI0010F9AF0E|nr:MULTISPECIES: hypothetical protein [unclassified Roseateles]MCZ7880861.1 hypothetical protein [Paucibacter sp. M5-1]MDC6168551.1 hypothetical protein [Paucibacter sp. XJ19-41]
MRKHWLSWLLAVGTGAAQAVIIDCEPQAGSFTVLLSEPSGELLKPAELKSYLERLQFELDQNRNARWINLPDTPVRFVACPGRAPALDGREHNPRLVDGLHTRRVLLEVWGQLSSEPGPGGTSQPSAQLSYLLVPLRQAANQNEAAAGALQRLSYPEPGAAPIRDPVQLVARSSDIDAFVASAFGFKLLRERSFDTAHRNLCRADVLLAALAKRPLEGRTKSELEGLRAFVLTSAGRAISEAKADAAYPKTGLLRLRASAKPCDEEAKP